MRLQFFNMMEFAHCVMATDDLMEHLAITAEAIPVWKQHQSISPTHKLSAHWYDRPVRVDTTFLFEQLYSCLCRVHDDVLLSKDRYRNHISYGITSSTNIQIMCNPIPYWPAQVVNFCHSRSLGMSRRFPRRGSFFGPGGRGGPDVLLPLNQRKRRTAVNTTVASVLEMPAIFAQGEWEILGMRLTLGLNTRNTFRHSHLTKCQVGEIYLSLRELSFRPPPMFLIDVC